MSEGISDMSAAAEEGESTALVDLNLVGPVAESLESDGTQPVVGDCDDSESATKSKKRWLKGKKRPAEPLSEAEVAEIQIKRIRQRLATTPRSELNTVMILNEYRKQLNYEVINLSGPGQVPFYTARVDVDGLLFEGSGTNKKKAKIVAAEAALTALFGDVLPPPDVVVSSPDGLSKEAGCESVGIESCLNGLNPTTVVNRLRPGTAYVDVDMLDVDVLPTSTSVLSPMYHISCVIDDVTYIGSGLSKKVARANAAAEALEKGFGLSCTRTSSGFPVYIGDMPQITPPSKLDPASVGSKRLPDAVQTEPQPQLLCSLPGTKTALMLLHELYPNVELTSSDVADENKLFHSSVEIEEKVFEGKASSKKLARSAAAIRAVNYLHQTGYLNMRLAEKASVKKPKWQPPQKAQFSQEKVGPGAARGGFSGQRGRGRGRGRAVRGANLIKEIKDSSWISGGVLKAGDFLGLNKASASTAQQLSFLNEQDYYSLGAYASDDSYVTANSSFTSGFTSPYRNFQSSSSAHGNMGSTPGFVGQQKTGFNRSVGSELSGSTTPNIISGRGRGRGRGMNKTSGSPQTSFSPRQTGGVQKLMELGYRGNNSVNPTHVTSFIDRQPNSFTSPGVMAPRKPNAVVQLSDTYNALATAAAAAAATAAHAVAAPPQQAVYTGYDYSYTDYELGYGDGTDSAAYSSSMTAPNQSGAQDYSIYYSHYGGGY